MLVQGHPIHFTYEGDITEVSKWIPKGQNILRMCMNTGIPSKRVKVTDSVEIQVVWMGGVGRLHIKAGGCPPFVSGLLDVTGSTLVDNAGKQHYELSRFYPREVTADGTTYGPWQGSKLLQKNFDDKTGGATLSTIKPGMFSGEMRKVVQVLIGQGKAIHYSPYSSLTHGVHTDQKGRKWVIEISSNGIRAWKLPVCSQASAGDSPAMKDLIDALGYYPISKTVPTQYSTDPGIRILATADKLAAFYRGDTLFPEAGWAFNTHGTAAINVSIEYDSSVRVLTGTKYRIDIIYDFEGAPTSTAVTAMESGIVYGTKDNHIKYPSYTDLITVSYDWATFPLVSIPAYYDSPVYCYYNDADEEITITCKKEDVTQTGDGYPYGTYPSAWGPRETGHYEKWTNQNLISTVYPSISSVSQNCLSGSVQQFETYDISTLDMIHGTLIYGQMATTERYGDIVDVYLQKLETHTWTGTNFYAYEEVVIPFWDRQAAYRWRFEGISGSTVGGNILESSSLTQAIWLDGHWLGRPNGATFDYTGPEAFIVQSFGSPFDIYTAETSSAFYNGGLYPADCVISDGTSDTWTWYSYQPMIWWTTFTSGSTTRVQGYPWTAKMSSSVGAHSTTNIQNRSVTFQLFSGSGMQTLPEPSYDFTVFNDPEDPNGHFMEVVTDAFTGTGYASNDMDKTGPDMIRNVSGYPPFDADSQRSRLFVGKP